MTASINACLAQLKTDLLAALVPVYADQVYAYRTFPDRAGRDVILTHWATNPEGGTAAGRSYSYDILAVLKVQYEQKETSADREAELESAEQAINDLEFQVFTYLEGTGRKSATLWHSNEIFRPSEKPEAPLESPDSDQPFVLLLVCINGAGKTTSIGKIARRLKDEGHSVMLAAGDTFRAAAVEQLQAWGERNDVPVIAQKQGSDSASVIFDALQAARARNIDVLIADTAGRLHTQSNLMEELKKIRRVLGKLDETAPHEVMLVVDAGTGQNALNQAREFNQAMNLTGITLTKLDGTARGGIIFAIAKQLGIPIRFVGVGEGIEDLRPFNARDFVNALFDRD
jgi:signal recognition particle-docking protein FtsY